MKAWAYLRTSTDDKGQDPLRQLDRIKPWAASEGVEIAGYTLDEGKSAFKTSPFQRANFLSAIENARDKGCNAIVVETGDRFTREGTEHRFVYGYQLRENYRLELWEADQSLESQRTGIGSIYKAIKAMSANEWIENHSKKVRSGMARKRCTLPKGHPRGPGCNGSHFGKPAKEFTAKELQRIWGARQGASPVGWRTLALEINKARGAFEVAGEERRRQIMVSSVTVRRVYANLQRAKEVGLLAQVTGSKEALA